MQTPASSAWWEEFRETFPAPFAHYLQAEAEAAATYQFDAFAVNGLLQTEAYMRAVCAPGYPGLSDPRTQERMIQARLQRQWHFFEREQPAPLHCVLDEAVLLRRIGGEAVLYEQLQHLLTMTSVPNVRLQILSWNTDSSLWWWYAGGSFELHDYGTARPALICREDAFNVMTFDDNPIITSWYHQGFQHLSRSALSTEATAMYLRELVESPQSVFQSQSSLGLWPRT